MFDDRPDTTVLKYYLYRAVGGPGFIAPVYVLYLLANGLSYAQIGAISAIQSGIVLVGEMPTGYVGDRIGRRNSLLVGQTLYALSALGLVLGEGFVAFALAFALLSFGGTFVSGSGDAWLYDTLKERTSEDRYTHVKGRGGAIGRWVTALTMVAGGFLYVVDPVLPFVAVLVMRLVTFGVVLSLPKNAQYADDGDRDGDAEEDVLTIVDALPVIRERLTTRPLGSFVAYMALFLGTAMTVGMYVQPIARDALQAQAGTVFSSLGIAEAASLGILYATFTATSAVASDHASTLESALGIRTALAVVPFLTATLFVLPVLVPVLAVPMFFGMRAGQSLVRPIAGQYVNDRVESVGRATVLSAVSMVYAVARIPFAVGSGVVADASSPLVAVAALGATFLVGGLVLQVVRPPVAAGTSRPLPECAVSD